MLRDGNEAHVTVTVTKYLFDDMSYAQGEVTQ
jgi:hypothetical protein